MKNGLFQCSSRVGPESGQDGHHWPLKFPRGRRREDSGGSPERGRYMGFVCAVQ